MICPVNFYYRNINVVFVKSLLSKNFYKSKLLLTKIYFCIKL
nr:MAG TPA: hypothetical protein [Caudoviricetes sp.]